MKQETLKHKTGMIFIFVIAVLCIIGAVWFFPDYILSGACFGLSIALLYVFFGEIKYRKGNEEILKENTTPRETVIGLLKSWIVLKAICYIVFIVYGGYIIYLARTGSYEHNKRAYYFFFGLGCFFCIGFSEKLIRTITSKRKIIISNDGINYDSKRIIPWSEIKKERIITKMKRSTGKYNTQYEAYYLSFKNKNGLIEICLEDYDITDNQMAQLLKIYRSRYSS